MIRIQRIVVTTDFSDESKKALRYAIEVAKPQDSELVLLHVCELPVYPIDMGVGPTITPPISQEVRQSIADQLENLRKGELPAGCRSRTVVREGRPAAEICAAARELQADLIVIATHGYSGIKHFLMGSTAERVVQKAPCPVLVVRGLERDSGAP